ncbi:hypothetical protein NE584_00740 [Clostridium sp. DFI.5.61]|uniref:hypothetical protein n=1 Tax=Clostridium sp. DFI.5.61 TaxID=2965279 RepID=UPI00210C7538|nr:hypothetical protein [Clostridium sp. DFI.5.61]MCB5924241.1 hypothetical protein [bacterium 210820-DFI.5.26]MCQ5157567.1 hypothetical protein [Clostridium sp. DFI.5.61]
MSEYGLTPNGPNIKRLDVILDEMHTALSKRWGVNTRQNPESFINHLLTDVSDQIAQLWELGEDVYHSQYPSSAEGRSLDNAAQYGGSTREAAAKSYYPIHCTGRDGTKLAAGTMISSTMNPTTQLTITDTREITRSAFNKADIKISSLGTGDVYTVAINGAVYSYAPTDPGTVAILKGLAAAIKDEDFTATVDEENELLRIEAKDITSTNVLVLSENLTTDAVTTIITFGTVDTGDILLPEGVITNIVKADAGLLSVVNICTYIAGRNEETDTEFRQSYADKIFNRSSMMLESIRSAILNNVQGVTSVAPYENPTHEWDEYGRPPHSIEIVVDGGDSTEIAQQILQKKAGGINTYGDTSVVLAGAYDEDITIRFSRPTTIYTWFHLGITLSKTEAIPPNYVDLLREVVLENMTALEAGADVVPQQFMSELYKACSGISYIDIKLFTTADAGAEPTDYPVRSAVITARQRAYTSEDMIEVDIDG